jgi:hypothetical protein
MSIATYEELQTAMSNWLHRDDLVARIPEFIAMGETNLNRKLRVKEMEASATVTPSQSVRYVALPTGYMEQIAFTDDYGDPLTEVDAERLEQLAYGIDAQRPYCYRISSRIDFEAVADTTYSFTLRYRKRLTLATDLTNSVLTNHPDAYLYASLMQSAPFIRDDAQIVTWKTLMDDAISEANTQSTKSKQLLRTDIGGAGITNILRG